MSLVGKMVGEPSVPLQSFTDSRLSMSPEQLENSINSAWEMALIADLDVMTYNSIYVPLARIQSHVHI
jgi:hypothetical protein